MSHAETITNTFAASVHVFSSESNHQLTHLDLANDLFRNGALDYTSADEDAFIYKHSLELVKYENTLILDRVPQQQRAERLEEYATFHDRLNEWYKLATGRAPACWANQRDMYYTIHKARLNGITLPTELINLAIEHPSVFIRIELQQLPNLSPEQQSHIRELGTNIEAFHTNLREHGIQDHVLETSRQTTSSYHILYGNTEEEPPNLLEVKRQALIQEESKVHVHDLIVLFEHQKVERKKKNTGDKRSKLQSTHEVAKSLGLDNPSRNTRDQDETFREYRELEYIQFE